MIYIIGLIVLAIIFQLIFGESGCGCLLTVIIAGVVLFVLWRFGILTFLLRIITGIVRFIFQQILKIYYKMSGEDDMTDEYGFELLDVMNFL